jgi:lysophospholipase L1-like esterase
MNSEADYVVLEGGINDYILALVSLGAITDDYDDLLDDTTFLGALESAFKQLYVKYPLAKIGYISVHKTPTTGIISTYATTWIPSIKEVCKKWGVHYIDLRDEVPPLGLIDALKTAFTYTSDGLHPNKIAYETFYVPQIEAEMMKW